MASYVATQINFVNDGDGYKHVVVYGGTVGTPVTFEVIYTAVKAYNPTWAYKIGTRYMFNVPLLIGGNASYYTVLDDSGVSVVVAKNLTSQTYVHTFYMKTVEGSLSDCNVVVFGDVLIDSHSADTKAMAIDTSIFECDTLYVNDSYTGDYAVTFEGVYFKCNTEIDNSKTVVDACTFDGICYAKDYTTFTGSTILDEMKIYNTLAMSGIHFEVFDLEFMASSKVLTLNDVKSLAFVSAANNASYSANSVLFKCSSVVSVITTVDVAIPAAVVTMKNNVGTVLATGSTNSSGNYSIPSVTINTITLAGAGDVVSSLPTITPINIECLYNSRTFYDKQSSLVIPNVTFKINPTIIYYTKLLGNNLDADGSVTINNRMYQSRKKAWIIRVRVYDENGALIDLSSATVTIDFYNNSFDAAYFKQYAATSKSAAGEAAFSVASSETAKFISSIYNYRVVVAGVPVINNTMDVNNG